VCEVLVTGEMCSADVLKRAAVNFIPLNGGEVMRTAAWRQLMLDQPRLVDYVVARLAGVRPPNPADYEEEKNEDGESVASSSQQKGESFPGEPRNKRAKHTQ
jgi:hypothetical protein